MKYNKKAIYGLCAIISALGSSYRADAGFKSGVFWIYKNLGRPGAKFAHKVTKKFSNTLYGKSKAADAITNMATDKLISTMVNKNRHSVIQRIVRNGMTLGKIVVSPCIYGISTGIVDICFPFIFDSVETIGGRIDEIIMNVLKNKGDDYVLYKAKNDGPDKDINPYTIKQIKWSDVREISPLEYALGTLYNRKPNILYDNYGNEIKIMSKMYNDFVFALNESICNVNKNNNDVLSRISKDLRSKIGFVVPSGSGISVITEKQDQEWSVIDEDTINVRIVKMVEGDRNELVVEYKFKDRKVKISFHLANENENSRLSNNQRIYKINFAPGQTRNLVVSMSSEKN